MKFVENILPLIRRNKNENNTTEDEDTYYHLARSNLKLFIDEFEWWMTNLPDYLTKIPILSLAIPGSHNSLSYSLKANGSVSPDEPEWIISCGKYCGSVTKWIIYRWSVTQSMDILQQLYSGIRYFDLRVATKEGHSNFFFVHGLYGREVERTLQDIHQFLQEHPHEVIILDFQHFYAMTSEDHAELQQIIVRQFRNMLCPRMNVKELTLLNLNKRNQQILVVYRNQSASDHPAFWQQDYFPNPWPNTTKPEEMFVFLSKHMKSRNARKFFISQLILTPNTSYVFKHITTTLENTCALHANRVACQFLKNGSLQFNIVSFDFIQYNNHSIIKSILDINTYFLKNYT